MAAMDFAPRRLRRRGTRGRRLIPGIRSRDSVEDVLSIADLSVAHPPLEFPQCLGTALNMVKDEKALHSRPFDEKVTLDPWALGWRIPARDGCRALVEA